MLLSPEDVKAITDRRIAASRADGCIVHVHCGDTVNLRFARNSATSNGARSEISITIESQFGGRSGSVTTTNLDESALDLAQRRSEEIAKSAPENPEQMPPLGPQSYATGIGFDAATAQLPAMRLAEAARGAIGYAEAAHVDAAGYGEAGAQIRAMATSAGLFVHDRQTKADFTVTAQSPMG